MRSRDTPTLRGLTRVTRRILSPRDRRLAGCAVAAAVLVGAAAAGCSIPTRQVDVLWNSGYVSARRRWDSEGKQDHAAVAALTEVAAANGWIGLIAECDPDGVVSIRGNKTINDDGEDFTANLRISGPVYRSTGTVNGISVWVTSKNPPTGSPQDQRRASTSCTRTSSTRTSSVCGPWMPTRRTPTQPARHRET